MKRIKNIFYWRVPEIEGIEICRVVASRHVFPRHAHEDIYAVGLMEKGGSYCLTPGDDTALVGSGEVALINPAQVHTGTPANGCPITYRMLYFDLACMLKAAGDVIDAPDRVPEFNRIVVRNPVLYDRLLAAWDSICGKADPLHKESAILEAAAHLLATCCGPVHMGGIPGGHRKAVRTACELLSENLDKKLSLQRVADAVGLSRYHFLRVFKMETGLSPHQFRTQRRIDAAQRLLTTGIPFAQVALATGFTDQSHFTHKFKRFIGATPSQYISGNT